MKTVLFALLASAVMVTGVPALSQYERDLNERDRKSTVDSIQTFSPYLYNELHRLQGIVDTLKQEDPTNTEAIQTAERLVKKQRELIDSREQKLNELQATTANN